MNEQELPPWRRNTVNTGTAESQESSVTVEHQKIETPEEKEKREKFDELKKIFVKKTMRRLAEGDVSGGIGIARAFVKDLETVYKPEELETYMLYHILGGSSFKKDATPPNFDLKGGLIEEFIRNEF